MIAHVHQSTICSQKVKSSYPKNPGPQTQTHRVSRAQTPAMQSPTPAMESPRIVRVYYPQRRPGGPHFSSFLAKKYHRTRDKKRCYLTKSSLSDSLLTFIESFSYPLDLLSFHFCFSKHSSFRLQIASHPNLLSGLLPLFVPPAFPEQLTTLFVQPTTTGPPVVASFVPASPPRSRGASTPCPAGWPGQRSGNPHHVTVDDDGW